ncbi:hypothetical protein [Cellulomonas gilvus]|uniref:Uncharacterized protein n=1 Tax=Cellulomonas gilvus (strain ATCC 13127 / NRRL B-14078) TaxID=593907 RepID=F8A2F3_CELGA|nr:hypothetical protein [Cellulomonas gilvus]AEI11810.1 hypothetical protein Celgi_1291 [Cellulomonas gilvus ATCC 13127]
MTTSGFRFGSASNMIALPEVQAGVSVSSERPSRDIVMLSGSRYVQTAKRAARTWEVALSPWSPPSVVGTLTVAAQGLLDEAWLLDEAGARANMLAPEFTAGVVGEWVQVSGYPDFKELPTPTAFTVYCRSGVRYRLTGVTKAAAGAVLGTTRTDYGSPVNIVAPAGTGARPFTVSLAPTYPQVEIAITSGLVAGLRLAQAVSGTTFADTGGFLPGQGTPCRVQVVDPARVLQMLPLLGHGLSDYTVTLREVGIPGVA